MRRALRFGALVLIQAGVLLLADVGVTLAWQEPVSALLAAREQAQLEDELARRERQTAGEAARLPRAVPDGTRLRLLAAREAARVEHGEPLGRIELPTLGERHVIVEGTSTSNLRRGPAHYPDSSLPGQNGTFAVAGHRTTYGAPFSKLDKLDRGESIVAAMPYGRFTYEVEKTRILKPSDVWVTRRVRHERLVLTACHPLYSASERIVVFARLAKSEAVP